MYLKALGIHGKRHSEPMLGLSYRRVWRSDPSPTLMRNPNDLQPSSAPIGDNHAVCTYRLA